MGGDIMTTNIMLSLAKVSDHNYHQNSSNGFFEIISLNPSQWWSLVGTKKTTKSVKSHRSLSTNNRNTLPSKQRIKTNNTNNNDNKKKNEEVFVNKLIEYAKEEEEEEEVIQKKNPPKQQEQQKKDQFFHSSSSSPPPPITTTKTFFHHNDHHHHQQHHYQQQQTERRFYIDDRVARYKFEMGRSYYYIGQYQKSIQYLTKALIKQERILGKIHFIVSRTLLYRGLALIQRNDNNDYFGDLNAAIQDLNKFISIHIKQQQQKQQQQQPCSYPSLFHMDEISKSNNKLNHYETKHKHNNNKNKNNNTNNNIVPYNGYQMSLITAYIALGMAYEKQRNYIQALNQYNNALTTTILLQTTKDTNNMEQNNTIIMTHAHIQYRIGSIFHKQKIYHKAVKAYMKSLSIYNKLTQKKRKTKKKRMNHDNSSTASAAGAGVSLVCQRLCHKTLYANITESFWKDDHVI